MVCLTKRGHSELEEGHIHCPTIGNCVCLCRVMKGQHSELGGSLAAQWDCLVAIGLLLMCTRTSYWSLTFIIKFLEKYENLYNFMWNIYG